MLDYPLELIARVLDAAPPTAPDVRARRAATDSRTAEAGDLFFALKGENFDGHAYAADALRRGAVAAVVRAGQAAAAQGAGPVLEVPDPLLALGQLAAWHRNRFPVRVVAVTGSVGKTTTKDFVASVLSRRWRTLKSPASYNGEIGVALTLLRIEPEHEAVVVEMAMRGPGQIRCLARMARPEAALITNIGSSHMELLGSQAAIAAAKAELLDFLPRGGLAALNRDDDYYEFLAGRVPEGVRLESWSLDRAARATVTAGYLGHGPREAGPSGNPTLGARFTLKAGGGQTLRRAWIPLLGEHNVRNAAAAAALGQALGVSWLRILRGLSEAETSAMRMQVHRLADGSLLLDDAYNASSPEAMLAALATLNEQGGLRKVAVLGSMLELGPASEEAHRRVGAAAAGLSPALLVTVGSGGAGIADGAREAGFPPDRLHCCPDNPEALRVLRALRLPGDTVLVKGSRGMAMEAVVRGLRGEA